MENQDKQQKQNDEDDENAILRPDIHSQLNELLSPETHPNAPTTLFVDNLLNSTYVTPNNQQQPDSNSNDQFKLGPLSLLYNKPYSISPNNLYQSIVITQLSDQIKTKDDIDVQVIYPNELHLIATGKSLSNCTQYNSALATKPRSKSTSSNVNQTTHTTTTTTTTVTKIELDEDLIITQTINNNNNKEDNNQVISTECQTDIHLDPTNAFTRNVCTPSLAETESISFYYIDEAERLRQLESMLSDDNYYATTNNNSDPCLEFESYLRGRISNGSNSNPGSNVESVGSRSRANSSPRVKYETTSTQTFLSVLNPLRDEHRSTQTSPELLRKYLSTLTPLDSPETENKPIIKTKTVAVIHTAESSEENDPLNKIRETFTIRDKSRLGEGVQYAQISEYKTDLIPRNQIKITDAPQVKIHESIVIKQDNDDENDDKAIKKHKEIEAEIVKLKEAQLARLRELELNKLKELDNKLKLDQVDSIKVLPPGDEKRTESVETQTRKKLGHSTIEITQVTNNTTQVTGLSLGGNVTDRFSMSVNMPSVSPTGQSKTPKTESVSDIAEVDTSNKIIDVIIQSATKPAPSMIQSAPTPPSTPVLESSTGQVKPLLNETKKPTLPPPLPKSLPASKTPLVLNNKYTEEIYDPKFVSKRKPIILECNDPQLKELDRKIENLDEKILPESVKEQLPQPLAAQPQVVVPKPINTIHKQLVKQPPVINRVEVAKPTDLSNTVKTRLNVGGFVQPLQKQQQPAPVLAQSQIKPSISRRSIISSSSSSILSIDDPSSVASKTTKSIESEMRKPSMTTLLSETSKLSFNAPDAEILDIDFDVYEQNAIERQVHEVEVDENDNVVDNTELAKLELSKTLVTDLSYLNPNVIDIDLSVYDEEPKVIQRATPSPSVYSQQQQQQQPNKPPQVPIKTRQYPTKLSNSSVSLNTNFTNQNTKQEPFLAPKKLYSDWQNLIQDVEPQNAPLNKKNLILNYNNTNKNFQSNLSLNFEEQKQANKLEYTDGVRGDGDGVARRNTALSMSSTVSGLDTGVEADIDEEFTKTNKRTNLNRPRMQLDQLMPPTNQFNQRLPQSLPQLQQNQQVKKVEPRRDFILPQQQQRKSTQSTEISNQVSLVPVSTQLVVDTEHNITSDLNLIRNLRSKFKNQQIASQQQYEYQQHQYNQQQQCEQPEQAKVNSEKINTTTTTINTNQTNINSNQDSTKTIPTKTNKFKSNSIIHNASLDLENITNNLEVANTSIVQATTTTTNNYNFNGVQYSSLVSLNKDEKSTTTTLKQSNISLDTTKQSTTTKMQKIMNSTAEKEYQKLLRRIERRRIRVPQILEQLETCKNIKEKRKLEEELRILLRKSERDNILLARYRTLFQAYQTDSHVSKTDDEEDEAEEAAEKEKLKSPRSKLVSSQTRLDSASMTSFSTLHSRTNPTSTNSLNKNESINNVNDDKYDEKKYKTRTMARESGYSSCGDESGNEHIHQINKHRNESLESILQQDVSEEDDNNNQQKQSPIKSAIKSNVVDKILIDSSNFILPKAPNLRITNVNKITNNNTQLNQIEQTLPQIQPRKRNECNDILNRQTSKLDDLSIEVPQVDIVLPSEIMVNSGGSERRMSERLNEDRLSTDSPDDYYNPNQPQRNLFPNSGYSGRSVPLGSTSSSNSGSYRAVPANTSSTGFNQSTPRQQPSQPVATSSASSINISPLGNNVQSTASSSLIRPAEPIQVEASLDDFTVEYINENSLGDNYLQTYQVQLDPQTGQYYIINYLKKIKYIIVPNALLPDVNINNYVDENNNNVVELQEENRNVEYIEEADLAGLTDAETLQDPVTGETLIYHLNNRSQQWVVLPSNWRDLNYIDREDLDTSNLDVFIESDTRRKYVLDNEDNKRYLIDTLNMKKDFREKWSYFSHLKPQKQQQLQQTQVEPQEARLTSIRSNGSQQTPHVTSGPSSPGSTNNQMVNNFVNENDDDDDDFYVDEQTLQEIDLTNGKLVNETGEVVVYHSVDPNTRWVVLPDGWRLDENANYVDEKDIDLLDWDVYVDETSKRRYVTDEKTGQRFYIVKCDLNKFKLKWNDLIQLHNKLTPKPQIPLDINTDGLNEAFNSEPSNFKLRSSLKNSPEPNNNLHLKRLVNKQPLSNLPSKPAETKLIIKQPGKPGHLITPKKPVPNKPSQQQQQSISKSKSPLAKDARRTIQQQNALRAQQEAARRAFLNQKMPNVGKLWIHQMLIDNQRKVSDIRARLSQSTDHRYEDDEEEMNRNRKHWKSLTHLNDPTMDADSSELDRNRLADVQIYGYNKFDKKIQARERIDDIEDTYNAYWKDRDTKANERSNIGFGGGENTFVRGVLTEDFRRHHYYTIKQMNKNYRALVPQEYDQLKQQFLLTPRYLKDSWEETLSKSWKLKPRIILINDNERILTANKNCNVYVQFDYDNDSVLGANPLYQFMLPDCGPVAPTRPLLIAPSKIDRLGKKLVPPGRQVDLALRDAPVYVYHRDGSAFYENIAQYLAGRYPQLSPQTARKILQFADMKEFEDYLASKITREEAKRISAMSGSELIDLTEIRNQLMNSVASGVQNVNNNNNNNKENSVFLHNNCEYDPLRNLNNSAEQQLLNENNNNKQLQANDTHEIKVGNHQFKSTLIGFKPTGQVEKLKYEELPVEVRQALQKIPQLEKKFFADSNRKKIIPKI